ncbi:MAG: ABC transporter permease [Proteobacteria bacterium]|nr:ABC transporter permease [Pseudomonadota bacterium]MBU1710094.1 ABC transporter permease [Pseudomonadota bacterium]
MVKNITHFIDNLGKTGIGIIDMLGSVLLFFLRAVISVFQRKQLASIVKQIYFIGTKSILIVLLVGIFTGMVLGLQLYHTLVKFGAGGVLGSAVGLSLIRELGPVLTAMMITARAGSSMTTEIGIQRITEQIDALSTMGVDPMGYIVSPRIIAAVISFPLLTTFFDLIGIFGGYISGVQLLGLDSGAYFFRIQSSVEMEDITSGFFKAVTFALIVSTICCYQGYFCHLQKDSHGAKAVGNATTTAVVTSCVLILIADYVVTSLLF